MMIYVPDVKIGDKFGRLTFQKLSHRCDKSRQWFWFCKCDCGKDVISCGSNIRNGYTNSCGCYQREQASKAKKIHGASGTELYSIWKNIKQRCCNPKHKYFYNYGGRGITICDEWKHDFERFSSDVGVRPGPEYSLDRKDNNLGYFKENMRWATDKQQHSNRRCSVNISVNGTEMSLKDFCKERKIDYQKAYTLIIRKKIKVNDALAILGVSEKPSN